MYMVYKQRQHALEDHYCPIAGGTPTPTQTDHHSMERTAPQTDAHALAADCDTTIKVCVTTVHEEECL